MKNLNIGTRLAIAFGVVLLLLAVTTMIALLRIQTATEITDRLINRSFKNQSMVAEWSKMVEVNLVRVQMSLSVTDPEQLKALDEQLTEGRTRSEELKRTLEKNLTNPEVKAQFDRVMAVRAAYVTARAEVFRLKNAGKLDQSFALYQSSLAPIAKRYSAEFSKLSTLQSAVANGVANSLIESSLGARTLLITLGLLALAVGIGFACWITGTITGPIKRALEVAETVSAGDLSSVIEVSSRDETGRLMQALKDMNENLVRIVAQVRNGTEAMSGAATEIAAGNLDLSSRTEQQASSLEETASSMEELTATVRQNADNAREANRLASDAAAIADRGGAVVSDVVVTMSAINTSSKKIVDIISVIDGIAFQTNILALNAAVEAARAGEQGRGFAVVASEVRNLAQRSAAAAKEIKSLIDDSVQKVDAGTALVDQAGSTMTEIVQGIGNVTRIMTEISHASIEQSAGIEQVNQAIGEMDQVTQQNAALVEQAAAAAESMQEQAAQLAQLVSVFKMNAISTAQSANREQPPPARRDRTKRLLQAPKVGASTVSVQSESEEWKSF